MSTTTLIFWVPAGAVVLLIPAWVLGARAYTRRQKRLDAEAIAARSIAADDIGAIPEERTVAEIAADGMTDDERRDERLAAWFAYDYDGWVVARTQAAHHSMQVRGRRAEARCERAIDRALREFGSSLALVAAEKLVAACHSDFAELAEKVDRPVAIDETGEWTEADDTEFWALIDAGRAGRR